MPELSLWAEGFPAIMVTDTAFYRNAAYHSPYDTPEKLDYECLARVFSLVHTILELAATNLEQSTGSPTKGIYYRLP